MEYWSTMGIAALMVFKGMVVGVKVVVIVDVVEEGLVVETFM